MPEPSRRPTYLECRDALLLALGDLARLGARSWTELAGLTIFPGVSLGASPLIVPEYMLPPGPRRRLTARTLDPSLGGALKPEERPEDACREEAVRRCLLTLWLQHRTERATEASKPSTWIEHCRMFLAMAGWVLEKYPSEDGRLLSHLEPRQVAELSEAFVRTDKAWTHQYGRILTFLERAGKKGILVDFPVRPSRSVNPSVGGERSWEGVALPEPTIKPQQRVHQPFPDEFVSAIIGRALWVQRNLAEQLVACWGEVRRCMGPDREVMAAEFRWIVSDRIWRDAEDQKIRTLPFDVIYNGERTRSWPPRCYDHLHQWIEIVQGLNIHLVAFCTGARRSEIMSAESDALVEDAEGKADFQARTYKLVPDAEGEARTWPLHPAGVAALKIQEKLAGIVRQDGSTHIWFRFDEARFGEMPPNLTPIGVRTVERLGLAEIARSEQAILDERRALADGTTVERRERAHLHRWRKTVARLVALTTVGAPQILLDLFGHSDIAMSLGYMLSDPRLIQDARRIAEERTILLSQSALEDVLAGNVVGAATDKMHAALARVSQSDMGDDRPDAELIQDHGAEPMRQGRERFGQAKLRAAARALTMDGKFWRLVGPGIICTKVAGQFGPCMQGRGEPDAGNCQAACDHRLETAAARHQCRRTLDVLMKDHAFAQAKGMTMVIANLEEQIRENLGRWDTVRNEMLATDPVARRVWEGVA